MADNVVNGKSLDEEVTEVGIKLIRSSRPFTPEEMYTFLDLYVRLRINSAPGDFQDILATTAIAEMECVVGQLKKQYGVKEKDYKD